MESAAPTVRPPAARTGRNIIVCCDGTQNEFGDRNSNVVKLVMILPLNTSTQLSYYDPGVGTLADPRATSGLSRWWSITKGSAFGAGLTRNVSEAYEYLMNIYQDGDKVFLFGFSRGAYTVRVLAGLLHKCGLLDAGSENLIPYAIQLFKKAKNKENDRIADAFKETFSKECRPHFMGVWDTVSSVGWIYDPVTFPFTYRDPDITTIRHAVALDERRAFFRQNLFANDVQGQDCLQVWFAGVHSDIGGGYPERESSLSKIPLKWMVDEAKAAGMAIDQAKYDEVVLGMSRSSTASAFVAPDAAGPIHNELRGWWWIGELLPRRFTAWGDGERKLKWRIPLGRPRIVPRGSVIHPSVEERISKVDGYRPRNLPSLQSIPSSPETRPTETKRTPDPRVLK